MFKTYVEKVRGKKRTVCCCTGYLFLMGIVCLYEFFGKYNGDNNKIGILQISVLCIWAVFAFVMSCVISIKEDTINGLPCISKKIMVFISIVIFLVYRVLFLINHKGYFSFDEFYHISTLNRDYVTSYDRAPYINGMVKMLCKVLWQSDFIVKLVPLILGAISFGCALYLLYNIYDNSYWILIISIILIFVPYIANNHFYIRMYVFLEAIFMLDSLLFYNAVKKRDDGGCAYIALAVLLTTLYTIYTSDFSAKAILLIVATVSLYYFFYEDLISIFKKYKIVRIIGVIFLVCCLSIVAYLVAVKQHWIRSSLLESELALKVLGMNLETFYHAESPVFLKFIFLRNFYVSIPFLFSAIYICKRKDNTKKILFIVSILPLLGYIILLYNSHLIRTYMAFFPIVCIVAYLSFDKIKLSNKQYWALLIGVLVLSLNGTRSFWNSPGIANETGASNVGGAMKIVNNYEKQDYEIVSLMTYKTQTAYFDLLDIDISLNREDLKEELRRKDNTLTSFDASAKADILIIDELEKIFASNKRRIIVADNIGLSLLKSLKWEEIDKQNIEMKEIKGNAGIVIVN